MRLLLFGQIRDAAEHLHGAEVVSHACSVREFIDWLARSDADFAIALARPGLRFAVDRRFATLATVVAEDSEVAVMSPLSGG